MQLVDVGRPTRESRSARGRNKKDGTRYRGKEKEFYQMVERETNRSLASNRTMDSACAYMDKGNYNKAEEVLKRSIEACPQKSGKANFLLMRCNFRQGKIEDAEYRLSQFKMAGNAWEVVYYEAVDGYVRNYMLEKAEREYVEAMQKGLWSSRMFARIFNTYYRGGDAKGMERVLQAVSPKGESSQTFLRCKALALRRRNEDAGTILEEYKQLLKAAQTKEAEWKIRTERAYYLLNEPGHREEALHDLGALAGEVGRDHRLMPRIIAGLVFLNAIKDEEVRQVLSYLESVMADRRDTGKRDTNNAIRTLRKRMERQTLQNGAAGTTSPEQA